MPDFKLILTSSIMASLTDKEVKLLKVALGKNDGGPGAIMNLIDFDQVYGETDYKDARNAKEMFRRLLIKLQGGIHKTGSPPSNISKSGDKPKGVSKPRNGVKRGGRRPKKAAEYSNGVEIAGNEEATERMENGAKQFGIKGENSDDIEAGVKEEYED